MKNSGPFFPIFAIVIGIFSIICAVNDYDWFMNSSKARFFVKVFGRDAARGFYVVLGLIVIICGVVALIVG